MVLVKNANPMMITATLLNDGIELGFADGVKGLVPYAEVPDVKTREGIPAWSCPTLTRWSYKQLGARASRFPGTSPGIVATQHTGLPSKP